MIVTDHKYSLESLVLRYLVWSTVVSPSKGHALPGFSDAASLVYAIIMGSIFITGEFVKENMKSSGRADVSYVVQLLQELQYSGVECTDEDWINKLLFERGEARDQLLLWLLALISPPADNSSESWAERTDASDLKSTLQSLSSLGLCRPCDTDLVSGSAPVPQQLQFWVLLAETACDVRAVDSADQRLHSRATDLLHALCSSTAMAHVSRCEASSVLPGDLQDKYKAWCRHNKSKRLSALPDSVADTETALAHTLQQLDQIPKEHHDVPDAERLAAALPALADQLSKLNQSGVLFSQMYATHLASWIRTPETSAGKKSDSYGAETGRVVHETHEKLQRLSRALASTKAMSKKMEELQLAEAAAQRCLDRPPSVAAALHRVATAAAPTLGD